MRRITAILWIILLLLALLAILAIMLFGGEYNTGGRYVMAQEITATPDRYPVAILYNDGSWEEIAPPEYGSPHTPAMLEAIPTPETAAQAPEQCLIRADGGAWVRRGAGVQYRIVGSVLDGSRVAPVEWALGWARIENPAGWVAGWLVVCG